MTVQEAESQFGLENQNWNNLVSKMEDGDELWKFDNGKTAWRARVGRRGIVLLRNGE